MCEVFKVSLPWIRHKACIKCCICSCGIPFNVSYCCIHLCSRFLSHFYVCFCLAVSVSPFFLLGWGHHMHGLFVWSCYRNSCECVSVCVNMSVWRGCSSASCVMTSSRHRPRHIESVCFHGLCNGESPTHTQTHIHTHTPAPLADAPQCCALLPDHRGVMRPYAHQQVYNSIWQQEQCVIAQELDFISCISGELDLFEWDSTSGLFLEKGKESSRTDNEPSYFRALHQVCVLFFSVFRVVTNPPLLPAYHLGWSTWRSSAANLG